MSYKVIARKYRPQNFEEVIGQDHITKTISKSISQGRVAHAYLFSGPHGVGKTSLARIIAKALNCKEGPTDKPCGKCSSCEAITSGTPLDVIEVDGASNRGIENIRSIIENVRISPVGGKYKVYIIDEVHQITNEAFNALLKTLEEPPPHVVFILATTEATKILPTIRSRCQQYTFKLLSLDDMILILKSILSKETIEYDNEAIFLIAKESRGSVRDAETILEKMIAYTADKKSIKAEDVIAIIGSNNFGYIKKFFDCLISGDKKEYFLFIKSMFEKALEPKTFMNDLIEYMRIVLMMKSGIDDIKILEIPESERTDIVPFCNHFNDQEIEKILEHILNVEERIRVASQPKTIFEMRMLLLLDMNNLMSPINTLSSNNNMQSANDKIKNNIGANQTNQIEKQDSPIDNMTANTDDKKILFYRKILSFIEVQSPAVYSLLSQGKAMSSAGAVLIVELPDSIYEAVTEDKRINELVQKAISNATSNKNVHINFRKSEEPNDVLDKLKNTLGATEVD